ncbi:hypothetical protein EDB89DRAFT_2055817 [Lactarius sanguifluus]|nr:hypothetical protein EDB89DRAFT_2055817 [Lactarius sanguifluus]
MGYPDVLPDFTFVCPTEILAFNNALAEFSRLYTMVLAMSTDSGYSHHVWAQQARSAGGLGPDRRIPLLVDRNMRVAHEYGCLIDERGAEVLLRRDAPVHYRKTRA